MNIYKWEIKYREEPHMKKLLSVLLALTMLFSMVTVSAVAEGTFTPGTYTGTGKGFVDTITVTVTVDENGITEAAIEHKEAPGDVVINALLENNALVGLTSADELDTLDAVSSATYKFTVDGLRDALADALNQAAGVETAPIAFVPGTYTGTGVGCNGPMTVEVTFTENAIESIDVTANVETDHVGNIAFPIVIDEIIACTSTGVDTVSGATLSSKGLLAAVEDAAAQAGCDIAALRKGAVTFEQTAQAAIDETYDVVIIGAGGAGIAAAAQAAQDGSTVLVIEKNAEVGGNTLVSGGQYQSVMPYLVWDANDPDATTGVYAFNGETYDKVKSVQGCINELKMILDWSEEPFDAEYYKDHEFVAGDAMELSRHGVHAEYLPTLQALKTEIQAYLDWAQPQLDAGVAEGQLTLFSTLNLHIFQTYYGGLRPSADGSEWCYGDVELVKQFIEGGQGLKEWLEAQGSTFIENTQPTLIGALWYRENEFIGATIDGENFGGRWGAYFAAPMNTVLKTSATAGQNKIMTRTEAKELIVEDGRVTGVKAVMYDGTEVTARATKGVIIATGGYAANVDLVLDNNIYWSSDYVTPAIKTTNRSSLQGDGIVMAQAAGADVTGLGFTQMMPISWVDNGNLAFGGGNYACWINPTTGHRFVDEGSERDVLSLAEFRNGMEVNGTKGVFLEFYNKAQMMPAPVQLAEGDYAGRYYRRTIAELPELFAELGVTADVDTVVETIRAYDMAVMTGSEYPDCGKAIASRTVGDVQKDENGKYLVDTYDLDNTVMTVRLMAPSTHHTMGGLKVDLGRHVLDTNGNAIPGLYAAGEVTGGIHGGNRLGGNAIVEIFVSGRTAAQAVNADAQ